MTQKLDTLARMFLMQYEMQKLLGNIYLMSANDTGWQKYVNLMTLAMVDETMEMVRETAFKNPRYIKGGWKRTQAINKQRMREEIIDMWFFLLNLSLAAGYNASDLFKDYKHKYKINLNRIEKKY